MERKEIDKTRPVTYYLSLTDEQLNFLSSNEGGINRIQCFRRLLHHTAMPIPPIPSVAYPKH